MQRTKKQRGFTIVELLVVIVVLSILASVTVVGYGSWRQRIAKKEVQTDLSSLQASMKSALNFASDGKYPAAATVFKPSKNVILTEKSNTGTTYCVEGKSVTDATIVYYVTPTLGTVTAGTCP